MSVKQLRWFGTDGIWGLEFEGLFIPSVLTRIGCALSEYLHRKFPDAPVRASGSSLWVLMGMDTQHSGCEFSYALSSGLQEN